ncbi:MAG: hypothetical protein KAS66_08130 [Candidatus Omnitrophica bacterium]|nr:hypothetical protein [Candidatus Omnitrophota bacterium]
MNQKNQQSDTLDIDPEVNPEVEKRLVRIEAAQDAMKTRLIGLEGRRWGDKGAAINPSTPTWAEPRKKKDLEGESE